jgi:hypothetical protein
MNQLERECRTYTRYLTGQWPPDYVCDKYREAHRKIDALAGLKPDAFDQFLVDVSSISPFWTRLADSYASRFAKDSGLRKKLVTALAILECTPPMFERMDAVDRGGLPGAIFRLGLGGVRYAAFAALSIIVFSPFRLGFSMRRRAGTATVLER